MDGVTSRLEKLGEEVRRVSDAAALRQDTLVRVRRRLLQPPRPEQRRSSYALWVLAPSMAFVLMAVVGLIVVRASRTERVAELAFLVNGTEQHAAKGAFIEADEVPVDVRFSEGTSIAVMPKSGLHVLDGDAQHVGLLLARGSARLSVKRLPSRQWTVRAGPFLVRVTGTRFEVSWDPNARRFQLDLSEGCVEVAGPHLPRGRSLVAGERLEVQVETGQMTLSAGPSSVAPEPTATPAPVPAPASDPRTAFLPSSASGAEPCSWQGLARAGEHRAALARVEAEGFGNVLERANAVDLKLLADTARFGGQPRRARDALLFLRKRFGARGETAFLLGKIEADHSGAPREALRWFESYLAEAPGGVLREQALGRTLELLRGVDPARARSAAERYLREYPAGAYASLARKLAEPGKTR